MPLLSGSPRIFHKNVLRSSTLVSVKDEIKKYDFTLYFNKKEHRLNEFPNWIELQVRESGTQIPKIHLMFAVTITEI